jgi:hypothetical protein
MTAKDNNFMGEAMRKGQLAAILMALCGLGLTTTAMADTPAQNPRLKTYGQYNPKMAKKAQTHVRLAMQKPMAELMKRAAEINSDYLLAYGLGLELGRPPATRDMTALERAKVQEVFQSLLVLYVRAKDGIKLNGDEAILLDQPDFWILMARSVGFVQRPPSFQVTDDQPGATTTTVTTTDLGMITASDGKRYTLTGEPTLNPMIASAAQTCAIYARVDARMHKVMMVDAAAAPHLTPEALTALKVRAKDMAKDARVLGIDACAGAGFYDEVRRFAGNNLGKLGTLKDDPAALGPEETPLPSEPAK